MKNKIKIFLFSFMTILTIYFSLVSYILMTTNIEYLTVRCLEHNTSWFIPKGFPDFFLFYLRGDKKDIDFLNQNKGISFILSSTNKNKNKIYEYASFFLEQGVDVNLTGFDGFTALHDSILLREAENVSFLLEKGANIEIEVGYVYKIDGKEKRKNVFGMNAVEYACYVSQRDKQDRRDIIQMLAVTSQNPCD